MAVDGVAWLLSNPRPSLHLFELSRSGPVSRRTLCRYLGDYGWPDVHASEMREVGGRQRGVGEAWIGWNGRALVSSGSPELPEGAPMCSACVRRWQATVDAVDTFLTLRGIPTSL